MRHTFVLLWVNRGFKLATPLWTTFFLHILHNAKCVKMWVQKKEACRYLAVLLGSFVKCWRSLAVILVGCWLVGMFHYSHYSLLEFRNRFITLSRLMHVEYFVICSRNSSDRGMIFCFLRSFTLLYVVKNGLFKLFHDSSTVIW